jgi:hypothetical protein
VATFESAFSKNRSEHRFFGGMAIAMGATVIIGFARSYYLRPLLPPPAPIGERGLTPFIHLHGALFTAWIVLLVVQARLAAGRHFDLHRRLGFLGGGLPRPTSV